MRVQDEYFAKQKKLFMCSVHLEMEFVRVPRKVVEWAMRKKGIPEALATALMSQYKGARTKVKVGTYFSEEFAVDIGVHQGSFWSPMLLAIAADVVTNEIKEGMLDKILHADDIELMTQCKVKNAGKFLWFEKCTWE